MSPYLRHSVAALVGAALAASIAYGIQHSRTKEAQALRSQNEALRKEALAKLRAQPEDVPSAVSQPEEPSPLKTTNAKSTADYRFEGQSTPVNTLQSFAWACDQGDIPTMKTLITFDAAALPLAEAYFASLPAPMREKTPDVETLAAMLLVDDGMHRPYPRAELLARATVEPVSAHRARTRLPGTPRDGGLYENVNGKWKFVITKESVERYLATAKK